MPPLLIAASSCRFLAVLVQQLVAPAGGGLEGGGGGLGAPSERLVGGSTAERLCMDGQNGASSSRRGWMYGMVWQVGVDGRL